MYGLVLICLFLNLRKEFSAKSCLQTRAAKCQAHILLFCSPANLLQISDFRWRFCLLLDIKHSPWKAPLHGRHCWGASEDADAPGGAFQQGSPGQCWCLAGSSGFFSVWWMWSCGGICQKKPPSLSGHVERDVFSRLFQFLSVKVHVRVWCESRKLRGVNEIGDRWAHLSARCVTHQPWFAQSFGNMRKVNV